MSSYLDGIPLSGITRIRDMMFAIDKPYRLDQGDVSFDAPDSVKLAMSCAIAENQTHYLQTNGIPRLREVIAAKLQTKNGIEGVDAEHILVTNGAIHGLYALFQALLEPGDEVLIPDPAWPPTAGNILAARGVPVGYPLYESQGWRFDVDELQSKVTAKTRVLYVNSPHNPTGGMLTRDDLERLAQLAVERDLWIVSDEAYEDIVFEGVHTSIASFPGLYGRTIPVYTFSKSYAMTGLRLGYLAIRDQSVRDRTKKVVFFTASNISSVVQHGGIGALAGPQDCVDRFRAELKGRRDLFCAGAIDAARGVFSGAAPPGAFYAFLRIDPAWRPDLTATGHPSLSWRMTEYLIKGARIGCVPGMDFGARGEGYVRFCFARERSELTGALESMRRLFGSKPICASP